MDKKCFIPLKVGESCPNFKNGMCLHENPQFQDNHVGDFRTSITCWSAGIQVNFERPKKLEIAAKL